MNAYRRIGLVLGTVCHRDWFLKLFLLLIFTFYLRFTKQTFSLLEKWYIININRLYSFYHLTKRWFWRLKFVQSFHLGLCTLSRASRLNQSLKEVRLQCFFGVVLFLFSVKRTLWRRKWSFTFLGHRDKDMSRK